MFLVPRPTPPTSIFPLTLTFTLLAIVFNSAATAAAHPDNRDFRRFSFAEPHMGTLVRVVLYTHDETEATSAAKAAFWRIRELNSILSDYDPESELSRLSRHPHGSPVPVSDDLFSLLSRAREISKKTGGAFDITAGPVVQLWRDARRTGELPAEADIRAAKRKTGYRHLLLDSDKQTVTLAIPGMQLDPGGIGKGYAADEALQVIRSHGISRAMVAAGGDIALGDPPPGRDGWRIGVAPFNAGPGATEITETVTLSNRAISTSGDAEQFIEIDNVRYSHIVDPRTGLALTDRLAATVIAPDATTADALATALTILGPEKIHALAETLPDTKVFLHSVH